MDKLILNFCKKYKEKIANDKNPVNHEMDFLFGGINVISFDICIRKSSAFGVEKEMSITLDEEDLQFLYNKYRKQLIVECVNNIDEVITEYETIL